MREAAELTFCWTSVKPIECPFPSNPSFWSSLKKLGHPFSISNSIKSYWNSRESKSKNFRNRSEYFSTFGDYKYH